MLTKQALKGAIKIESQKENQMKKKSTMSFQERAKLAMAQLSKQLAVEHYV